LGGADIERRPRGASHEARSKEMASLTDRAIAGKIAMGDIRTGEPFDTAKLFSFDYLRKA